MKIDYSILKKYLPLASIGIQFGLSVIIGVLAGKWLDGYFGTFPWLLTLGIVFGFAAGIRAMIREINLFYKNNPEER